MAQKEFRKTNSNVVRKLDQKLNQKLLFKKKMKAGTETKYFLRIDRNNNEKEHIDDLKIHPYTMLKQTDIRLTLFSHFVF